MKGRQTRRFSVVLRANYRGRASHVQPVRWPNGSASQPRLGLALACLIALATGLLPSGCTTRGPANLPQQSSTATQGQVLLAWDPPTTRVDGSPLTDIVGYKLYYGLASGVYTFVKTVGAQTTYALSGLDPGQRYYIGVTASDSTGLESRLSEELTVTAPLTFAERIILTQDPIIRGQAAQFRVRGAQPDEVVVFFFSEAGEGEGPCSSRLGGLCIDLLNPRAFGEALADASGTATIQRTVPTDSLMGPTIATQAVIQRGPSGVHSVKTNAITAIIID